LVVVVVPTTGDPDFSSVTTSWWATTVAGRSVTSAATMEVAVHTIAVDPIVAASHSTVENNRDNGTPEGCSLLTNPGLREP